ncbi:MAG TPA: DUF3306 domain-containing protein [Rubrivivax sp.]|nr:DUF3306 domain-containing protein [Rubrivivax sp.]
MPPADPLTAGLAEAAVRPVVSPDTTTPAAAPVATSRAVEGLEHDGAGGPAGAAAASPVPQPTLEEARALTPASDFTRFVAPGVDTEVKNAAMKKLFADPHFNVMDGLDTYIDDYGRSDPIPKAMLRQMVQARMLGLLDDELEEQPQPERAQGPDELASAEGVAGPEPTPDAAQIEAPPDPAVPEQHQPAAATAAATPDSPSA